MQSLATPGILPASIAQWQSVVPNASRLSIGFGSIYAAWGAANCGPGAPGKNQTGCLAKSLAACSAGDVRSISIFEINAFGCPKVGENGCQVAGAVPPESWWQLLGAWRGSKIIKTDDGGGNPGDGSRFKSDHTDESHSQAGVPREQKKPGVLQPFSVLDYGAVGDGHHDDTDAIQLALDAAGAATHGKFLPIKHGGDQSLIHPTLVFPAGVYMISRRPKGRRPTVSSSGALAWMSEAPQDANNSRNISTTRWRHSCAS